VRWALQPLLTGPPQAEVDLTAERRLNLSSPRRPMQLPQQVRDKR
jgi:hypothetical protein